MEYKSHYNQPFTLGEAIQLDISTITEEISRLQNSLFHLKRTQEELQEAAEHAPDPEFDKALEENEDVIGSQEERISILKMALTERGVRMGGHYEVISTRASGHNSGAVPSDPTTTRSMGQTTNPPHRLDVALRDSASDDEGIHL